MTTAAQRHEQTKESKNQVNKVLESSVSSEQSSLSPSLSQKQNNSETDSEKSESFTEQVSKENEKKHEYKQLSQYAENSDSDSETDSEIDSETDNEEEQAVGELAMDNDDAEIMAAFGVNLVNGFLPSLFKAPVSMSEEQQEDVAVKAVPLVKKYYSGDNVPEWIKKYQDEFAFGLALGGALFGCHQQAKAYKKQQLKNAIDGTEPTSESTEKTIEKSEKQAA